mmetsp:Transcript_44605/g.95156  ORF Transcript_44605/g.95156 Transcript_44605/m.95156 type:complete len:373 (-) Transcript_44605:41-1159(-)
MRVSAVLFAVAAAQVADETKGYRNAWNDCGGKGASETMRMKTIAAKIKGWAKPLPFKRHSAQDCENGSDGVETTHDELVYPNPETFSKADAALEKAEKWTEQGLVPTVRPSLKGFKKTRTFETGAGAVGTKTGQTVVTGLLQLSDVVDDSFDEDAPSVPNATAPATAAVKDAVTLTASNSTAAVPQTPASTAGDDMGDSPAPAEEDPEDYPTSTPDEINKAGDDTELASEDTAEQGTSSDEAAPTEDDGSADDTDLAADTESSKDSDAQPPTSASEGTDDAAEADPTMDDTDAASTNILTGNKKAKKPVAKAQKKAAKADEDEEHEEGQEEEHEEEDEGHEEDDEGHEQGQKEEYGEEDEGGRRSRSARRRM